MVTAVAQRLASQRKEIDNTLAEFTLSLTQLQQIKDKMREELERGLRKDSHESASVKMLPTYVYKTPDGTGKKKLYIGLYIGLCFFFTLPRVNLIAWYSLYSALRLAA